MTIHTVTTKAKEKKKKKTHAQTAWPLNIEMYERNKRRSEEKSWLVGGVGGEGSQSFDGRGSHNMLMI
jgi:hypothetical protein